ncbi:hypothetical protein [uncultured Sphingomonas sp.]|uniref:hypothetical protein n=1 Tax=uncultured Sphingomonas sp. TaxID=158754 RepID=UPI00374A1EA7
MTITIVEMERQRVAHLVLGEPRPKPTVTGRRSKRKPTAAPPRLAPGIEERVALREEWRGIEGTPETLQHAHEQRSRPGALARLVATGAIDLHQLAAAEEIALAYSRTVADVAVRTADYSRALSGGRRRDAAGEGIAAAFLDIAYTAWRQTVAPHAPMLLEIIVDDVAITAAAAKYRMSNRRARQTLIVSLDRWRRR